jgi:hypothetical protein
MRFCVLSILLLWETTGLGRQLVDKSIIHAITDEYSEKSVKQAFSDRQGTCGR